MPTRDNGCQRVTNHTFSYQIILKNIRILIFFLFYLEISDILCIFAADY